MKFYIRNLTVEDARRETDTLNTLREIVLENEEMYPNIGNWFNDKVVPGICSGERLATIGYFQSQPVATSILKYGKSAKLCHIRILEFARQQHLGEAFLSLMIKAVIDKSQFIHLTIPENIWIEQQRFFESFGFTLTDRCAKKYRSDVEELVCSVDVNTAWRKAANKLPKLRKVFSTNIFNLVPSLILSVSPKYALKILDKSKTIEIRKKFSTKWINSRVALYATTPIQAIVGEAIISDVVAINPEQLWQNHNFELGCDYSEFKDYVAEKPEVFAIRLKEVIHYEEPVKLNHLRVALETKLMPPQSYALSTPDNLWGRATSLANILYHFHSSKNLFH